jgi:cell division transport system permease protein
MRTLFRLLAQGIRDLTLNPWAQLLTLVAVTLVAFLSGLFLMALTTLNYQLGVARGEASFQVYWHPGTDMPQIREQWNDFALMPDFQYMRTFTPEEALKELGEKLGRAHGDLEKGFPFLASKSPLPATALLFFAPEPANMDAWMEQTTSVLRSLPGVDRVMTTPLRDELGRAWRQVSRYIMWPSVAFLTMVLGLVVGNTVRLSLLARAHEIEILQLAGAYNWYIRLPLIVSGAVVGLGGSLMAMGMLDLVHSRVRDALNFPPLLMEIRFPPMEMLVALVLVPTLMAAAASWLAVRYK